MDEQKKKNEEDGEAADDELHWRKFFPAKKSIEELREIILSQEFYRIGSDVFGRALKPSHKMEGPPAVSALSPLTLTPERRAALYVNRYRIQEAGGQLTFEFPDLPEDEGGFSGTPATGKNARRLLLSMIAFCYGSNYLGTSTGEFTARDIFKFWGLKEAGGKDRANLRRTFLSIASGSIHIDNKRPGRARLHKVITFCSTAEIHGEGMDAKYVYHLNPSVLGDVTLTWIRCGELTPEQAKELGGFVPYPTRYLKEPLDQALDNLRLALLTHRWGRIVRADTVLFKWAKVEKSLAKKPDEAARVFHKLLTQAKKKGIIGKPESDKPQIRYDRVGAMRKGRTHPPLKSIKVTFTKPKGPRARRATPRLTERQRLIYEEIVEWISRPIHGTDLPPEKRVECFNAAILREGFKAVHGSYKIHGLAAHPSIAMFWRTISPPERRKA